MPQNMAMCTNYLAQLISIPVTKRSFETEEGEHKNPPRKQKPRALEKQHINIFTRNNENILSYLSGIRVVDKTSTISQELRIR